MVGAPLTTLFVFPILTALVVTFVFSRHGKAIWLAIDHFCDPHVKEPDDPDGGGE